MSISLRLNKPTTFIQMYLWNTYHIQKLYNMPVEGREQKKSLVPAFWLKKKVWLEELDTNEM